jgi:hypothetical protein
MFLVDSFWPLVIDYQKKGADPDILSFLFLVSGSLLPAPINKYLEMQNLSPATS